MHRRPLRPELTVGPDGKGTFVGPGVPEGVVPVVAAADGAVPAGVTPRPRDIFTTTDFYNTYVGAMSSFEAAVGNHH